MTTVAIISDTHGYLPPSAREHLEIADEIWHAGDIGSLEVLKDLQAIKKTIAVYGNIDAPAIRHAVPENQFFETAGVSVLIRHIVGGPGRLNLQTEALLHAHKPKLLVCGHSHVLRVQPLEGFDTMYINPGALGRHGLHEISTMLLMDLHLGQAMNLRVVELGPRGKV